MKTLFEKFETDFFLPALKGTRTHLEAFGLAKKRFEEQHGFEPFPSFDSFRMKKNRHAKKNKRSLIG